MLWLIIIVVVGFLSLALIQMTAPLTSITGTFGISFKWNASQALANAATADQNMIMQDSVIKNSTINSTGAGANAANQMMRRTYSINASSSTSIDLSAAFVNIANNSTATFARIKSIAIRLLSVADDGTLGTAAVSIICGNSGANDWVAQGNTQGLLASATSVTQIANGGWVASGTDNAAGCVVDGTHKILKIANNDGAVTAVVQVTALGADA